MPGPMSIPNRRGHDLVKVVVRFTEKNQPVYGYVPVSALTGEQRAYLASRRLLHTGKTDKKKDK